MIIMKRKDISCFDDILDKKYGRVGTEERKAFREEAVKHSTSVTYSGESLSHNGDAPAITLAPADGT